MGAAFTGATTKKGNRPGGQQAMQSCAGETAAKETIDSALADSARLCAHVRVDAVGVDARLVRHPAIVFDESQLLPQLRQMSSRTFLGRNTRQQQRRLLRFQELQLVDEEPGQIDGVVGGVGHFEVAAAVKRLHADEDRGGARPVDVACGRRRDENGGRPAGCFRGGSGGATEAVVRGVSLRQLTAKRSGRV